jgi:hypothetical protein
MAEVGVTGIFITAHVGKQVAKECEFNVNGKPVALWGPLGAIDKTELGDRLQNATALEIDRLEADLLGKSHIRRHLRCVHITLAQKVFGFPHQKSPNTTDRVHTENRHSNSVSGNFGDC